MDASGKELSCTIGGDEPPLSRTAANVILLVEETTSKVGEELSGWRQHERCPGEHERCPSGHEAILAGAHRSEARASKAGTLIEHLAGMPLCLHLLELPSMKEQSHVTHLTRSRP